MQLMRTMLLLLFAFLAPVAATLAYHSMASTGDSQSGMPGPVVGEVLFFTSPG